MIRRPPRPPLFPSPTLFRSPPAAADTEPARSPAHRTASPGGYSIRTSARTPGPPNRSAPPAAPHARPDRKSTRLNSSHLVISYAVFCLKKKKNTQSVALNHHAFPKQASSTLAHSPLMQFYFVYL